MNSSSTELFSDILITTLKTQFRFLRIYHVATNNMYYQHNWRGWSGLWYWTWIAKTSNLEIRQHPKRRIRHLWQWWKICEIHFQNRSKLNDYCHNYAETVRMIKTIAGCSLHHVCDGNSRKVCNTCHTHHFKISICHCSESYRSRLKPQ